jgi:predicted DNA binding protein
LGSCLFCLRKGRVPIIIEKGDPEKGVLRRCFRVCRECFSKCIEKGLLREVSYSIRYPSASESMKKVWCYFVDEGILSLAHEKKKFHELVWSLLKDLDLLRYMEVVEVLSKLDERSRDFLVELYERREPGQNPFDYVCVDDEGGKYLVDVASVKGVGKPSPLSEREKRIVSTAKERGFRVLVPVVRFLNDWKVRVELVEL